MDIEKAVTPEEMKGLEKRLIEAGIPSILLMENAAAGIARAVSTENQRCPVYIFCGRGNNGGDGLASARHLAALGFDPRIALLGTGSELKGDAKANFEMAGALGIPILEITEEAQLDSFYQGMQEGAIVDALLGTGLSKEVDGLYKTAIERMNSCGLPVYSADIPSGIDGETGRVMGAAVRAEATITFLCAKTGLLLYPGREYAGRLIIKDLGARLAGTKFHREFIPGDAAFPVLPPRKPDANKGSCGKLAIVAGSEGFAGAGELCAKAAVRCGAGLVTVGVPHTLMEVYQAKFTEPMTLALPSRDGKICMDALAAIDKLTEKRDAVAIGPGLGRSRDLQNVLEHAVKTVKSPLVIDADGLNNLEGNTKWLLERKGATVLTPHPVELARLLGCDAEAVLKAPVESAEKMSREYGAVVALKCGTNIVASPDGQTTFCLSGNAGMATGGSGDVLTGVILALLGSGLSAYDAARIGCHINGCAGDMAAEKYGERSMIPSDTIEALPEAIEAMSEC